MELAAAARAKIDAGDREAALTILTAAHAFPLHAGHISLWRAELLLALDRGDESLDVLDEALAAGSRFKAEWLRENRKLAPLQGTARFEDIVARGASRYARDQADARPAIEVHIPTTARPAAGYPIVFALHGNNSNVGQTHTHWMPAVDLGWLVALPQSSEIGISPNAYTWNDRDRTLAELEQHLAGVREVGLVDEHRIVLAGFSMGGLQALALVLTRRFPALGALSVGAYLPHIREFSALIATGHAAGRRFYLVVGDKDPSHVSTEQLATELEGAGVDVTLDVRSELGHAYPPDMNMTLRKALSFFRLPAGASPASRG